MAGGAHGHPQPDPALRPDDAAPRPDAAGPWLGAQEGRGGELPGRAVRGSVQRSDARFKVFDKIQTVQPGAIVDNKRLSAVLEQVKAQQAAYPARQQRGHVARQRPPKNLEAPGLPSKGRAPRHLCSQRLQPEAAMPDGADGHGGLSFRVPFNGDAHRPSWLAPCRGRVGFSGIGRSTPMACEDGGLATPGGGSRPVPIGSHPSE